MALINPCSISSTPANTGSECNDALKATALLIMLPKNATWGDADLEDFTTFIQSKIHASPANRWFPIFGSSQPVRNITESNENDVTESMEDGSVSFVRYGMYNRTYVTDEGGMCLAKSLMDMKRDYSFIEVDIEGQVAMQKKVVNGVNVYSGFQTNLAYAPAAILATLKTVFKIQFMLSFNPMIYIKNGHVLKPDASEDLLSLRGLYDVTTYKAAAYTKSGNTRATGGRTITNVGADNDTYDMKVSGVSVSGGPVTKTSSESTVTLLAAKIVAAINAATSTNGGYTATNSSGAITISAPAGLGDTINTITPTATIVGTITDGTATAFSGGVTGTAVIKFGVKTDCAETDLIDLYGSTLGVKENFTVTNAAGAAITISAGSIVGGVMNLSIPFINGTYTVGLASAATLLAAGIIGYESTNKGTVVILN